MRVKNTALMGAGFAAGAVAGLFGAGGGMVLVPLLSLCSDLKEEEVFPASVTVMTVICLVCLGLRASISPLPWAQALPYLAGSAIGGVLAGIFGGRIPAVWLHRGLGILILWGGWRYLWHS